MRITISAFLIVLVYLLGSCGNRRVVPVTDGEIVYQPKYATGFSVTQAGGGKILNIHNPWQGEEDMSMRVFLSADGSPVPDGFEGVSLSVPLQKVVCMSSTYVAYISELGCTEAVKGVSGAKYISDPKIREGYRAGSVAEVGYDAAVNFELLSAMKPDVVFAYGITGENDLLAGKLAQLGIKMVYVGDYVEQSPLGKAEWLVAFGYMFAREETAKEVLGGIAENYNTIKDVVERNTDPDEKPVVMLNSPYRDVWFVPGDRSYMARLIEDAGGSYACSGVDSDQSRPISMEEAYVKMLSSGVWLNPGLVTTLSELKRENPRFASTPPVVGGNVYNNNKRNTPEGGSDFWESGAVRPDIVLADMVTIFYPDLLAPALGTEREHELYYFHRLE